MPPVGAQRERREQQGGQAERLVGRRRRVHDGGDPVRVAVPVTWPSAPAGTAQRTDQDVLARSSAGRSASSAGSSSPSAPATRQALGTPSTVIVRQRAVVHRGEQPGLALDGDLHVRESGEREQQRRPGLGEQPGDKRDGGVVPQRQLDRRLEALGQRASPRARSGERQPQHGHVAGPRRELVGQRRDPADQVPGQVARPLHRAGLAVLA